MTDYPSTTPPAVREWHRKASAPPDFPVVAKAYRDDPLWKFAVDKIAHAPRMAPVWTALEKKKVEPAKFARLAAAAYSSPPTEDWDLLPPAERRRRAARVVRKARALAKELTGVADFDLARVLQMPGAITDEVREKFIAVAAGEPGEAPDAKAVEVIERAEWHLGIFAGCTPSFAVLLQALAEYADRASESDPLLPRPNSPHAHRTAFVRKMLEVTTELAGTPLREHVATLANLLYPDDKPPLTGSSVASIGRQQPINRD